jgi:hypothetical protein
VTTDTKTVRFEEFVPCTQVENEHGYIPYDYSNTFNSHVIIPSIDDRLFAEHANVLKQAHNVQEHVDLRT